MSVVDAPEKRRPAPGGSRIRKLILDKVRLLGTTEHQEIFQVLQSHNIAYSSNTNGVFINLSTVPDDILATVKAFVDYCADNKKTLDEYEKRIQECKITHKFDRITQGEMGGSISGSGSSSSSSSSSKTGVQGGSDGCEKETAIRVSPDSVHMVVVERDAVSPDPLPVQLPLPKASPSISSPVPPSVPASASASASAPSSVPSPMSAGINALTNGRFQAAKKRFSRRKIIDRRHAACGAGEGPATSGLKATHAADAVVLTPEVYVHEFGAKPAVT